MSLSSNPAVVDFAPANTCTPPPAEEKDMARRRFQRGSIFLRGKRDPVWVGRWREDVVDDGRIRRVLCKEVLGTKREFPTKKLAMRELESRIAPINSRSYTALHRATFADFAAKWRDLVLVGHKQSTQSAVRSVMRCWLIPFFGSMQMREITREQIVFFLSTCKRAPKTRRNFALILRMILTTAREWSYISSNPIEGLKLPVVDPKPRMFFSVDEVSKILSTAEEPYRTLYWLAAETGLRAGELCGLRLVDIDLPGHMIRVRQSVWQGRVQKPKTRHSIRELAISPQLAEHLLAFLKTWRPNAANLLFASKTGKAWAACNVIRANLRPLLATLKIPHCGLHAFRHTSGSLMDRLNTPTKVRQERLGHAPGSDVTMLVYTHSVNEDHRKVAEQLGTLLCPNVPESLTETLVTSAHPSRIQ